MNFWRTLPHRDELQLILRNGQHDEVGSYRLTPPNVYVGISTVLLVVAVGVFLLLAYTPLRDYLPGREKAVDAAEVAELREQLAELSDIVDGQSLYIETLRRTVSGVDMTEDSVPPVPVIPGDEEIAPLPPSEAEIALRRELAAERTSAPAPTDLGSLPAADDPVNLAQIYLVPPVNGEVSAAFNPVIGHLGSDILAPRNTAIKAVSGGVVFMSEFTNANGHVIGIQHEHNLISFYKHNSRLLKKVGDQVKAGEAVAIIGDTGEQSTGPHLHFELWHAGRAVDAGEYTSF